MAGSPLTPLLAANSSWALLEVREKGHTCGRVGSGRAPCQNTSRPSLLHSYTQCEAQSFNPEGVSSDPSARGESKAQTALRQSRRAAEVKTRMESSLRPGGACSVAYPKPAGVSPSKITEGSTWMDKDWPSRASKRLQVFPGSALSSFTLATLNTRRLGLVAGDGRGSGRLQGCESLWKDAVNPSLLGVAEEVPPPPPQVLGGKRAPPEAPSRLGL